MTNHKGEMMRRLTVLAMMIGLLLLSGCGSSWSSGGGNADALVYATYGQTMSAVIPAGLKTGGVNADVAAMLMKTLSGTCADTYADCPAITAEGGGDSDAGEILMRLWSLDYNDECNADLLAAGTCFDCEDCETGSVGTTNFIQPTMIAAPTECGSVSTTAGRYVNLGVDPCFFDAMIGQITNIAQCETVTGGAVDISSAIPWYASWNIPQTVHFSSYYSRSSGGMWWTLNDGASANQQYFVSLDSNWLYAGIKNPDENEFLFFGSSSPAYSGSSGVNISGYAGPLDAITTTFEAIQVRDESPETYIERLRSNGSYVWYQKWRGSFPATPDAVDGVKNSPDENRCLQIGSSVVTSKYVPSADCVSSFGVADVTALNSDDNYTLKIIDGQTANSIDFSTPLTPTTESACLEEET